MLRPEQIADAYAKSYVYLEEDEKGSWLHFGNFRFLISDAAGSGPEEALENLQDDLAAHMSDAIQEAFKSAHEMTTNLLDNPMSLMNFPKSDFESN